MDEKLYGLVENKTRTCVIRLTDYEGFGFTVSPNRAGMHQVTSVETGSPAEEAGLRPDDLILKVNDMSVLGESYSRLNTLIENESECGQIKLEVIEPTRCPARLRNACRITAPDASIRTTNVSESFHSFKRAAARFDSNAASTRRAQKEPLVTNPHSTASDSFHSYYSGSIKGSRICTLLPRPDFEGFGFSIAANLRGPHKISQVETNSPADDGGLRVDDLILKVNDLSVVGERYSKTVLLMKNEFERGRIKLEVIAPSKCPPDLRNVSLKSNSNEFRRPNVKNLRDIIDQATSVQYSAFPDLRREPYDESPTETPDWPIRRQTVTRSYASVLLTEPETDIRLYKDIPSKALMQKSRFKKCTIRILPNQSFGFTFISMTKPKFMVFSVDPNSAAHKANLNTTDVVITMDGINIRRLKMKKVNRMLSDAIKRGQIELLVINIEGYMYYKKSKSKTLFSEWNRLVSDDNTDEFSYP